MLIVAVVALTMVLVTLARGYTFNTDTLEFEAGGLLILDSDPRQASIRIDGEERGTAPERLLLAGGRYDVVLSRSGYRDWYKKVNVRENEVLWIEYPFLIPSNVTTETTLRLDDPKVLEQSPNKRFIAIAEAGTDPRVTLYDSRADAVATELPVTAEVAAAVRSMTWSSDSGRLLLEVNAPGRGIGQWFVVDIDNGGTAALVNLEQNLIGKWAEFSSDSDQLHLIDQAGVLWRVNLGSGSRQALIEDVQTFAQRGGNVFAVKLAGRERELVRLRNGQETVLRSLSPGKDYRLMTANFDDKWRLVLHDRQLRQVTLIDVSGDVSRTETLPPFSAREVWLSPGQRFVAMYDGSRVLTYDFDRSRYYTFDAPVRLSATPTWFDEHHLLLTGESTIKMVEFDGGNLEELVPVAAGFPGFGVAGDRLLYSVGRSSVEDGLWLQISNLK